MVSESTNQSPVRICLIVLEDDQRQNLGDLGTSSFEQRQCLFGPVFLEIGDSEPDRHGLDELGMRIERIAVHVDRLIYPGLPGLNPASIIWGRFVPGTIGQPEPTTELCQHRHITIRSSFVLEVEDAFFRRFEETLDTSWSADDVLVSRGAYGDLSFSHGHDQLVTLAVLEPTTYPDPGQYSLAHNQTGNSSKESSGEDASS